jgi:DNA-binding CsgD family transcriptional regulator
MSTLAPWDALEGILSDSGKDSRGLRPCVIQGGWLGAQLDSDEYRRAFDQRRFTVVNAFHTGRQAVARITVEGRQIGTLDSIVATGRRFSTFAHVSIPGDPSEREAIVVDLSLGHALTRWVVPFGRDDELVVTVCSTSAASSGDLLDGDPDATHWARRWGLPPRLSRLAVLLMAGVTPKECAERLQITVKSVRTYTERLFALAGVHRRNELVSAVLRDGRHPP